MIYYTGDIHGDAGDIAEFAAEHEFAESDTLILLGDVGANYYGDQRDRRCKRVLDSIKPTVLCIHGNHEKRPAAVPGYRQKRWNGGTVWYEAEFPSLLFAKDGEIFTLEGLRHMAIGGAFSVDRDWRLQHGYGWWADEQPSEEIKQYVESQLRSKSVDIILSHTCPYRYEPVEAFLPMIDPSSVDAGTEHWLDEIEAAVPYKAWFCGHWHIDKRIDKMHFLFHGVESSEQFEKRRR